MTAGSEMAEHRRGRGTDHAAYHYPRTARVNEVLRQVLADEIERLADTDERLSLATVTGVTVDPDLSHAKVWLSSLPDPLAEGLVAHRVRLQAAIGRQVRLKRTPLLAFEADPAVSSGSRVEDVLRRLGATTHRSGGPGEGAGKHEGEERDG
jgi:ribosome-binding factor A